MSETGKALTSYEDIGSPLSVDTVKHQIQVIQQVMKDAMVQDTHFGVIPGCGTKPTLLKPGAEKLCLTFRLAPTYVVTKTELPGGHREYEVRCTLTHIPSGQVFGEGVGVCSTMESKYRYRQAERLCPACGHATIIKGKAEYGGGWLCYAKKGGCGAKFKDNDPAITDQQVGRTENPDIADVFNTVLKMAKKRAHVDAVLTATAASDIFAQDLEDLPHTEVSPVEPIAKPQARGETSKAGAEDAEIVESAKTATTPSARPVQPTSKQPEKPMNIAPIGEGPRRLIEAKMKQAEITEAELCKRFQIEKLADLKMAQLNDALAWLANPNGGAA